MDVIKILIVGRCRLLKGIVVAKKIVKKWNLAVWSIIIVRDKRRWYNVGSIGLIEHNMKVWLGLQKMSIRFD